VTPTLHSLLADLTLETLVRTIKGIVAQGGRVTLDHYGLFAAQWKTAHVGKTLTYTERGVRFEPSPGFSAGVKAGTVMTDAEAPP